MRERPLGEVLASVEGGVSVNSEDRVVRDGEIGVLKTSAVTYGTFAPHQHKAVVPAERARAKRAVRGGTILFSRMNTPGLVAASAYVGQDHPHLFLPDRLWELVAQPEVDARWLSHVLASAPVRAELSARASGTSGSMKNISKEKLLSLTISVPPLDEQRRIAAVLSAIDAAVAAQVRACEAGRTACRALGVQLVCASDAPRSPLSDIADCYAGGTPSRGDPTYFGGAIPWVKSGEVRDATIDQTEECLSEAGLAVSSARWVPAGATLVAMYGATAGAVGELRIRATTNQAVLACVATGIDPLYLSRALSVLAPSLLRVVQGSGQPNLSGTLVKQLLVPCPSPSEQRQVARALSSARARARAEEGVLAAILEAKAAVSSRLLGAS